MTWLAPLYLLAAVSIAAPILFHLWRRAPQQTRLFSSVLFLSDSLPQRTSQSRIDAWPLLLVRIGALSLLAIAFARPVWTMSGELPAPAEPEHWSILLVDTSASLQRDGLREAVRREAGLWFEESPQDRLAGRAVYTFDDHLTPLVPLPIAQVAETGETVDQSRPTSNSWTALHLPDLMSRLEAGERGGPLGPAVVELIGELDQFLATRPGAARATLTVISDFAESNELAGLAEGTSSARVTRRAVPITAALTNNASLQPIQGLPGDPDDLARVMISANPDCTTQALTVHWPTPDGEKSSTLTVPPGRTRTLTIRGLPADAPSRVWLTGDDHPFDNVVYLPQRHPPTLRVLYAGSDAPHDPEQGAFYWWGVLQSLKRYRVVEMPQSSLKTSPPQRPPSSTDEAASDPTATPHLVLWDDPRAADSKAVQNWLEQGTFVLSVPPTATAATEMLQSLDSPATVNEVVPPQYALLGQLDFAHPWLAPFREAKFSDFSGIHVWKYRQVTFPETTSNRPEVLMQFDDGSPALLWKTVGAGTWAMLLTDWAPADSQLARSSKFAPLILRWTDLAAAHLDVQTTLRTGNQWPGTDHQGAAIRRLELLEHTSDVAQPTTLTIDVKAAPSAEHTGHYRVISDTSEVAVQPTSDAMVLAVNLPASEGRTTPVTSEELLASGWLLTEPQPATAKTAEISRTSQNNNQTRGLAPTEQSQRLWQWGLLLVMILLIVEGIWTGRRTLQEHRNSASGDSALNSESALRISTAGEVS